MSEVGNTPGKLIHLDSPEVGLDLLIAKFPQDHPRWGGAVLVADLNRDRCTTYRIPGHWTDLRERIGITDYDARLVSMWLNKLDNIDTLLQQVDQNYVFSPTPAEERALRGLEE